MKKKVVYRKRVSESHTLTHSNWKFNEWKLNCSGRHIHMPKIHRTTTTASAAVAMAVAKTLSIQSKSRINSNNNRKFNNKTNNNNRKNVNKCSQWTYEPGCGFCNFSPVKLNESLSREWRALATSKNFIYWTRKITIAWQRQQEWVWNRWALA